MLDSISFFAVALAAQQLEVINRAAAPFAAWPDMIEFDIGSGVATFDTAPSIALIDDRFDRIWHVLGGAAFVSQLSAPLLAEGVDEGLGQQRGRPAHSPLHQSLL